MIDSVIWIWTAVICCETARRTYNKYVVISNLILKILIKNSLTKMGSNLPIKFSCFEIILILIFLILFLVVRILGKWNFGKIIKIDFRIVQNN